MIAELLEAAFCPSHGLPALLPCLLPLRDVSIRRGMKNWFKKVWRNDAAAQLRDAQEELRWAKGSRDNWMEMYFEVRDTEQQVRVDFRKLHQALTDILRTQGAVCKNYEFCQHEGCNSSATSYLIADEALASVTPCEFGGGHMESECECEPLGGCMGDPDSEAKQ